MRTRRALLAAALIGGVLLAGSTAAPAQVVPEPPPPVATPEELQPLLDLLGPSGSLLTEPGCASLGTALGLGTIVIPGLPSTIEAATGIPLTTLGLQPELVRTVDLLLFVQGSGCGFLPLAAERTVCAPDDTIANQTQPPDLPPGNGLPVNPGDLVPTPGAPIGALVDTVRAVGALGVPGTAEIVAALNDVGECELRQRFTNIEPPPLPPADQIPDSGAPTGERPVARPPLPDTGLAAPVIPARAPIAAAPPSGPATAITPTVTTASVPAPPSLPAWLGLLAALALVGLLYRSTAPAKERTLT